MRPVLVLLCGLVALASSAGAQQADTTHRDTLRFRLQPVEVQVLRGTAADLRTPAAVTTVGGSAIQDAQLTAGLDEALAVVPGVVVNNRYNFALGTRIAVRGLGARAAFGVRGVRLLQDGIPLTMPDGQANVNNVDLGSAGRIEVLRGPASSLYGNAAGGVVAVETQAVPSTGLGGELRTVAADLGRNGLNRLTKHQLKVGGQRGAADFLVNASRMETSGFRTHSQAEQNVVNARVQYPHGGNARWTALLNYANAPTAQNPGSLPIDSAQLRPNMAWPRNVETGAGESARQVQAGLAYHRRQESRDLQASVYGLTRTLENPLPFGFITLDRRGAGARASYAATTNVGARELRVTLGADLEYQSDDRGEFNNVEGRRGEEVRRAQVDEVTSAGPFVQLELALATRLALTLGARYDVLRFSVDDQLLSDGRDDSGQRTLSALSPRVALLYSVDSQTSLYASIGTAFQTPTTTELLNHPPAAGQPCCPSGLNPSLEPQHALNLEIGAKGRLADRLRWEVAAYQMNVNDALVPFQVAQGDGREFFRNAGETRHRGLETALTAVLARSLMLEAAYTYSRFTFVDDGIAADTNEGNALPGVPPHHLFARLRIQPVRALNIEIENEFTDRFFVNDGNTASNASANVVDLRIQLDLPWSGLGIRPFLAVNNITNEKYSSSVVINAAANRFYEPAPGRNLYLGAALRFGGW